MNFFETYYKRIIKQDLTNKFIFSNNKKIPKFKKVTLNFECKNISIQKFAITMLALEILTFKKGAITTANKPNVLFKIQKGQPAGCKVELKNKEIYPFLTKLTLEILPKLKRFQGFKFNNQLFNCFFKIPGNQILLKEFESHYPLFSNLPNLDINILANTQNRKEIKFITKAVKLPISISKKSG